MRDTPAEGVLQAFADALGIDTSQGSHFYFKRFNLTIFFY